MVAGAEHLLKGGEALASLHEAVLKQRLHAIGAGHAPQFLRRFALEGLFLHDSVHEQHLEDAAAAAVAGSLAVGAALALGEGGVLDLLLGKPRRLEFLLGGTPGRLALGADDAHEPLAHDGDHRTGHEERLNPDVDEAGDGAWRVVGVQRAEHQVAGERRLDGDVGRFPVADFADEDDVGRLAEHGADDAGEVEPDLVLHLHLVDAGKVVLDRILGGDDLLVGLVHLVHRGIKRCGLARAGGAGHQEDAVGALDDAGEPGVVGLAKAEVLDADHDVAAVEDAHDARLAVAGGQHAHPEVVMFFAETDLDAAVLAAALFGDVHVGHDLDAGKKRHEQLAGRVFALGEHAIDAVADPDALGERLDVDVAGPVVDAFLDDEVHQADDGRVALVGIGQARALRAATPIFIIGESFLEQLGHRVVVVASVILVDQIRDLILAGHGGHDFLVEDELEFGDKIEVGGIAHRDLEHGAVDLEWNDDVVAGDRLGDGVDHLLGNDPAVEVDELHLVEFGEGLDGLFLRDIAELDEDVLQLGAGGFRHGAGLGQLVGAHQLIANEDVAEVSAARLRHGCRLRGYERTRLRANRIGAPVSMTTEQATASTLATASLADL